MGIKKCIRIILPAAVLSFAGYSLLSGREEKVKQITARELPEGASKEKV